MVTNAWIVIIVVGSELGGDYDDVFKRNDLDRFMFSTVHAKFVSMARSISVPCPRR